MPDALSMYIDFARVMVARDRRIDRARRMSAWDNAQSEAHARAQAVAQEAIRSNTARAGESSAPPVPTQPRRETRMGKPLIEIKGLGPNVGDICKQIASVRSLAATVNTSGSMLAAELTDVHAQIEQARSDLRFQAESLGNSQSGNGAEPSQQGEQKQGEGA